MYLRFGFSFLKREVEQGWTLEKLPLSCGARSPTPPPGGGLHLVQINPPETPTRVLAFATLGHHRQERTRRASRRCRRRRRSPAPTPATPRVPLKDGGRKRQGGGALSRQNSADTAEGRLCCICHRQFIGNE